MKARFLSLVVLAFLVLCLIPPAFAIDRVIVNSQDWHDVYSGLLFANLEHVPGNFLVSQKHASILLYSISTNEDEQFVVSSRQQPFFVGYQSFLRARGYDKAEELITRNANLDLAERLTNVTKFIIIDPVYGYNAISAAPYAVVSNSYVLFADRRNIDDIVSFLNGRTVDSVILFGQLDREVKEGLAPFNPETVNEGDRFSNNLAMVKRYMQYADIGQVILTNGEFIESSLLSGDDPVIFIGRTNVPDVAREFIKSHDINVGILIGNELIGVATTVRRQLGISVFVKFAQGARVPTGAISQVEDLDRFPMPSYQVNLEIADVVYNKATRSLEVTYRNPQELALFFKSTITITGQGQNIILGDNDPLFLDKGAFKTVVYTTDVEGNPLFLADGNYTGDLFTIFGEGPKSLDQAIQAKFQIRFIEVMDDSSINITGLYYDKGKGHFVVSLKNTGDVDVYVRPELVDLLINDELVTVAADKLVFIPVGGEATVTVTIDMAEADFAENPQIRVRAYYGERENSLIKVIERSFALEFGGGLPLGSIVFYAAIILVVMLLLWFLGTKKKCKHCGHKNPRGRKTCQKCHGKL